MFGEGGSSNDAFPAPLRVLWIRYLGSTLRVHTSGCLAESKGDPRVDLRTIIWGKKKI